MAGRRLARHLRELAAALEASRQSDRARELARLAGAIGTEAEGSCSARLRSIRAIESVSLGCDPRGVADGSRVRLHRVGTRMSCRCPRVARHRSVGRGVAPTGEILVWHRPDCEVEP